MTDLVECSVYYRRQNNNEPLTIDEAKKQKLPVPKQFTLKLTKQHEAPLSIDLSNQQLKVAESKLAGKDQKAVESKLPNGKSVEPQSKLK